jgi:uncharacterized membrane protein
MAAAPPDAGPAAGTDRFMAESATSARREALIRRVFRAGLFLKAFDSAIELAAGAAIALVPAGLILRLAQALTRAELIEDPNDVAARFILDAAEQLSISHKMAAAFYLASHGAVKLFLVVMVLRERPWAYPVFMIALVLLIAYQSVQLTQGWSIWLAGLTVLDLVVLVLTWHEYRLQPGH